MYAIRSYYGSGAIEDKSKNWDIAGSAWRQAREVDKAIPAMEKAAAESDDGELYARLGNIYLDGDMFKKAIVITSYSIHYTKLYEAVPIS